VALVGSIIYQKEAQRLDKFDGLLLRVVDKNIRYIFGDMNTGIIYDYLEKKGCAFQEIPAKSNTFSMALRNMLGPKRALVTIRSCYD
jgi:hypothetical protein